MTATTKYAPLFTALLLALGLTASAPALAAKSPTVVTLEITFLTGDPLLDRYRVKIEKTTRKKCRKQRKAFIYHDEDNNGQYDKGEAKLVKGTTNNKGKLVVKTPAEPFTPGHYGAVVKATDACKKGTDWIRIRRTRRI